MAQVVQRREAFGLAWRIVVLWVVLSVGMAALGALGSVELALIVVLSIAGGFAWWRWL